MRELGVLAPALLAAFPAGAARDPVRARHAMVVTRESHATDSGVLVLAARGHKIRRVVQQGEVCAILWDGSWLQGAANGRTEATAAGY